MTPDIKGFKSYDTWQVHLFSYYTGKFYYRTLVFLYVLSHLTDIIVGSVLSGKDLNIDK